MRIHLIQIDVSTWEDPNVNPCLKEPNWYLGVSGKADLTVFPEYFPFNQEYPISNIKAIERLEKSPASQRGCTYIAGGYVVENAIHAKQGTLRNRVYLVHRGYVIDYYDKQIQWRTEKFIPGRIVKTFSWGNKKCIPLICADAYPDPQDMERIIERAVIVGASATVPIVVSSYGDGLTESGWTKSLRSIAVKCKATVVICNISGKSKIRYLDKVEEGGDGKMHPYGGGGSGLFLPGNQKAQQFKEPGIISIDTSNGKAKYKPFPDGPFV
jgi:predicted amidohydrolase